ncbi:hypothetical protein KC352_g33702, partial [Hortaea werneckii]
TLGMLSSGGVSPGAGFGGGLQQQQSSGSGGTPEKTSGQPTPYPASLSALLNDPMSGADGTGRTGLTPGYSGPDASGSMGGPASPFSQMLAGGQAGTGGFMGMDGLGGDIDWGAWDQYIQGTVPSNAMTLDPAAGMGAQNLWPMNIDFSSMDGVGAPPPQQPQQHQQPPPTGGQGVFMGAGTPGMQQ